MITQSHCRCNSATDDVAALDDDRRDDTSARPRDASSSRRVLALSFRARPLESARRCKSTALHCAPGVLVPSLCSPSCAILLGGSGTRPEETQQCTYIKTRAIIELHSPNVSIDDMLKTNIAMSYRTFASKYMKGQTCNVLYIAGRYIAIMESHYI